SLYGGTDDRVLWKSVVDEATYRLPDIAYHVTKFERGYDLIIDIFGADHHATYPDVLAGLRALGYDTSRVKVLIHQFVTLIKGGEKVKMSTRKANYVTLDELIDDVGRDVARYFFLMRGMKSHLNFDLDLAKTESEENPVFYLQYAHARICSILRNAATKNLAVGNDFDMTLLKEEETLSLLNALSEFKEVIEICVSTLEPQHLTTYLQKVATAFHKFYTVHRVISKDWELSQARLALVKAVQIVMANGLALLGISAPERM
ncbi:MAG: DALR anticodon-binding domain-containing protein, partial [Candidatus Neomarinimicrobiota bacterium]